MTAASRHEAARSDHDAQQRASQMLARFATVRARSLALAAPLSPADCQVQSMTDASPVKWHLAHVTWFFETFVLERFEPGFVAHEPPFRILFNSYYHGVGEQHPRAQRGLVTRPDLDQVIAYRAAVDERIDTLLRLAGTAADSARFDCIATLVELGIQHEQQHQELIVTDVKHLLSLNPLSPPYHPQWPLAAVAAVAPGWVSIDGGLGEIGHRHSDGFAFDNECPRHAVWLRPYALANRLVTHGEWADFVSDGGYAEPRWWLSAGWDWVRQNRIEAPLYWRRDGDHWKSFTLHGEVPIDAQTPIVHVSLYEAHAYAQWRSSQHGSALRLPTEGEWEYAAAQTAAAALAQGNFVESGALHPMPVARAGGELMQLWGDVWEWTSSAYQPHPGFKPWAGAVGEYNGKFMINQYVLRGGSCATPRDHIRASYRNFFPADTRWQFSGVRLARDLD